MKRYKLQFFFFLILISYSQNSFSQDTIFISLYKSFPYLKSDNQLYQYKNKYGFVNKKTNVLIPAIYDELSDVSNGLIKATKDGKVGFINIHNKTIIPFIYDKDTAIVIGRVYHIGNFYNEDGDKIMYKQILVGNDRKRCNFSEGLCAVVKKGKYGFIDTLGKTIISFKFEEADNFFEKMAIVKVKGKYGTINHNQKIIIQPIYHTLILEEDGRSLYALLGSKMFFLDLKGKEIVTDKKQKDDYPF